MLAVAFDESGLLGLLAALNKSPWATQGDPGDPLPSMIAPLTEPTRLASRAYLKAVAVRRRMYELWEQNPHRGTEELVETVAVERGYTVRQLERYLLIKRYLDSLDEARRSNLLETVKATTISLFTEIQFLMKEQHWIDPGEPDFRDSKNVPPPAPHAFGDTISPVAVGLSPEQTKSMVLALEEAIAGAMS